MERLGKRIQRRRKELGLHQVELEDAIGKSRSYISRIESIHTTPSTEAATELAFALGEDPNEYVALLKKEKLIFASGISSSPCITDDDLIANLGEIEKSCWYRSFSDAYFVLCVQRKLLKIIDQGVCVSVLLIAPTIENFFYQLQEEEQGLIDKGVLYIVACIQQLQTEYWLSIHMFKGIWLQYRDEVEERFKLRIFPHYYSNEQALIMDDKLCFCGSGCTSKRWWNGANFYVQGEEEFRSVRERFVASWHDSSSIDWTDQALFGNKRRIIGERDVSEFLHNEKNK